MGGGGFGLPRRGDRSQPSLAGSGSSTCPLTRRFRLGTDCANLFPCPRPVTSQGELEISRAGSIYTTKIGQSSPRGPLHPPRPCGETPSSPALPSTVGKQRPRSCAPPSKPFVFLKRKKSVVLMISQTLEQLLSPVITKKELSGQICTKDLGLCRLFI